ncbi:MAG: CpaF family protein [Deltaproteobacteria bacterium]|nr:CpaF family protein [Deltaproteobacteria bacterium]MBI3294877.1 CpaF family protein [Deltaproteobacteria bacterium]
MSVFETSVQVFLAPVLKYLKDESVTEIMINGPQNIFIERKGFVEKVDAKFEDENSLMAAVRNISQFVGRPIDNEHPFLDARLPDGSRIHAVVPPIARNGTTVAIRKFSKDRLALKDLISRGTLTADAARFLDVCLYLKKNIIVSGGTGTGKTTILGIMASRVQPGQRIVVLEDSAELKVHSDHVVFFEARPADEFGKGQVTLRDLVKSSLRLRPDRVIVGEVRSAEALDLISSMNTGHSGSMGTVHSNNPKECLIRLETLALMSETTVPVQAVRAQVAAAINIVLQLSRMQDGSRKVTHISEGLGMDLNGNYKTQDIYLFEQTGRDQDGKVLGDLKATGAIPTFMREIEVNQLPFTRDMITKKDPPKAA